MNTPEKKAHTRSVDAGLGLTPVPVVSQDTPEVVAEINALLATADEPSLALAKHLVSMGAAKSTIPVKYADMDFVVTVGRKADHDAEDAKREKLMAAEKKMRAALTHLSIIGERCDVKAAAINALEQKNAALMLAFGTCLTAALGVGAYLVVNGHPWFGLLAMLIGSSMSFKTGPSKE